MISIDINNVEWQILLVEPFDSSLCRSDGSYTLGCCDDNLKFIFINQDLTDFYLKKVLCHELTHAAMFSYEINLSEEQEEIIADIIATYGQEIITVTNNLFYRLKQKRNRESLL